MGHWPKSENMVRPRSKNRIRGSPDLSIVGPVILATAAK